MTLFTPRFSRDLRNWAKRHGKTAEKIAGMVESIAKDPFGGRGRPERLRYQLSGRLSRRINEKDRLVYAVHSDRVVFLRAMGHT